MAPELYLLGIGSHEADVWAMGVVIYQLLAGKRPWKNFQINEMQTADYSFSDEFDESAKSFIQGCLEVDPNKRLGWGENQEFEKTMFEHDFFKGRIDIQKIHKLKPPVDKVIVASINKDIDELSDESAKEPDWSQSFDNQVIWAKILVRILLWMI